jgi:hypothetical protein
MAKKTKPGQPSEVPDPQNPEVPPEEVPVRPSTPFEEPEIVPEDEPGGTSPGEIPVPDEPEEPTKQ